MSYQLPEAASLETLLDYATDVIAGLEAVPELAGLAAPWRTLRDGLRTDRDARDEARATLRGAQRKASVLDMLWDRALVDLSGRAFLAAGKNAGNEPYASLFGTVSAADATKLGAHNASAFGAQVVARANSLAHADLAGAVATLEAATSALETAGATRDDLEVKAQLHEITRIQRCVTVEKQVATTEVGVLTLFPGRADLVRATLAMARRDHAPKAPPQAADPVETAAVPA